MTIRASKIKTCQEQQTQAWHEKTPAIESQDFMGLVENNHLYNFLLWHEEDKARRDDQGAQFVYDAKRKIDHYNQQRNNAMEAIDNWLIEHLEPKQSGCPFHTETPGMIIDRLSILALKTYHMALQIHRQDVEEAHRLSCKHKFATLKLQQQHLVEGLQIFLDEIDSGTRSFRVYKQLKMYNDPTLNPQLYRPKHAKNTT